MARRWVCIVASALVLCTAPATMADFYDNFDDGWWERDPNDPRYDANDPNWTDPNIFDIDNPDWTLYEVAGDTFIPSIVAGPDGAQWLRLFSETVLYQFSFYAAVPSIAANDPDPDPNTNPAYWDDTTSHYILVKTANSGQYPDPSQDRGISVLFMHTSVLYWTTFWFIYEHGDDWPGRGAWVALETLNGTDSHGLTGSDHLPGYAQGTWSYPPDSNDMWEDPNFMNERDGFWMLLQFQSNGVTGDPNGKYMVAACWNGGKYDWNLSQGPPPTGPAGLLEADLGSISESQNWWPEWYWTGGLVGCASHATTEFGTPGDVAFDHIEARIGVFDLSDTSPSTLSLTVKKASKGTITIDPDILRAEILDANDPGYQADADPNDISAVRAYTPGTEVVLVATPTSGNSFKEWKIYDPNHPGDNAYAVKDTNSTLYLTMVDGDWQVEAAFKCGSSEALMPLGVVLLALVVGVVIRRMS